MISMGWRVAALAAAAALQLVLLEGLPIGAGGRRLLAAPNLRLRGGLAARERKMKLSSAAKQGEKLDGNAIAKMDAGNSGAGYMGSLSVLFYLLTSLSLTLMNKLIFSQFQYPLFVTEFQLIVSMVLLLVLGELSSATGAVAFIPRVEIEMKKSLLIAPVTCLFVTMLSFTNYCLRHVDIGFYQVLRSTVIPFNIILNYLLLDILPSAYASMCCLIVVSGFVLGSITELNFSAEGFAYGIISSILVALYSSSVKKILPVVENNTWRLMHYTTLQGIMVLAPAVALSGEFNLAMASPEIASSTFWLFMSQAAVAGFMINLAYFALIKFGSPLTTHVSGCTKTSLQTLLGIALFQSRVTPLNAGILLPLPASSSRAD